MGMSFCTIFEAAVPEYGTLGGDNPDVYRRKEALDQWATDHGLTPLAAFESYDPEDVADVMGLDELPAGLPPVQWFPAADGLAAVQALIDYMTPRPDAISRQAGIMDDLAAIADELTAAEQAGVRFRFALVP
jgi:hypothetical protein